MRSYLDGMLRYFEVSGRSTRMQYWMFFVVQLLVFAIAGAIDFMLLDGFADPREPLLPATLFVSFVHIVPALTVQVRRLHDIGRSGFWLLLYMVPLVGPLWLFYWACIGSEPGRNAHDAPEPSRYIPHYSPSNGVPRRTTIPRQVRMGSKAARPASVGYDGLSSPERFI